MNPVSHKPTGCFLIGVVGQDTTCDGNALIGSVSDDPYDIRTFLKEVRSPGKLDHIGTELISTTDHTLTERGYFARPGETTRGLNNAGLAFTCAMILEDESFERPEGLTPYADLTDRMMRSCHGVDDAVALFKSHGAVTPAYTVLLADASANLVQMEVGSFGVEVLHRYSRSDPGIVLSINCYQSQVLEKYNTPDSRLTNLENNNAARLERGRQLAKQYHGKFDVAILAAILSDHTNRERDPLENPILPAWGYSICNHGTRNRADYSIEDLPWGTVSAEISEPSTGRFFYTYGWTCGEQPEFGDQIFQHNSWGRFVPFALPGRETTGESEQIDLLSTIEGDVTAAGVRSLDCSAR
jgi:hypothetical protein